MRFATLFVIISAVLALPSKFNTDSNVIGLVKRADGSFVFPDDDEEPSVYVPKKGTKVPKSGTIVYPDDFKNDYTPKPKNQDKTKNQEKPKNQNKPKSQNQNQNQNQNKNQNQRIEAKIGQHPYKNAVAKNGQKCDDFKDPESLDEVPTECLRPVFCDVGQTLAIKMGCPFVRFENEILIKAKLKEEISEVRCVSSSICRWNDYYNM